MLIGPFLTRIERTKNAPMLQKYFCRLRCCPGSSKGPVIIYEEEGDGRKIGGQRLF